MSAEHITSLIQRKARTGRDAQAARAMTLGRALRLTAAKQADQLMGLAMSALGVTRQAVSGNKVMQAIDGSGAMLLMDGPAAQVGAIVLDPPLVTALIQQQIMGKVAPPAPPEAEPRAYTATDAALCAPFVEALLRRAGADADDPDDRRLLEGYRFGVWAKETRQVQLALEAPDYEIIEMTLDLAAGTCTGKLVMLLPVPVAQEEPVAQDDAPQQGSHPPKTLSDNVFGLNAELTIALTRVKVPLQRASRFQVGDVLDLDLSSLAQAMVLDANGRVISRGTLGQIDGMRAVQVEQGKPKQHTEPRRRASDREGLDLPDVTLPLGEAPALDGLGEAALDGPGDSSFPEPMMNTDLPALADVDVFGDLGNVADLPDIDQASDAADARMAEFEMTQLDDVPQAEGA